MSALAGTTSRRRAMAIFATSLISALALALAALSAEDAGAKKGGKSRTFEKSVAANLPVPDRTGTVHGLATSQITVPKKFKGKVVGDLNVTGIQTTGSGATAANDLWVALSAPNGRTLYLFFNLVGQNIGPLTFDDDTPTMICNSPTPNCSQQDPDTLAAPFAGTANLSASFNGTASLSYFNGLKMRGTWTMTVVDSTAGDTSVLNAWGLRIKAKKPVKE